MGHSVFCRSWSYTGFYFIYFPFIYGTPLRLFRPSSQQSFSISTAYAALCILWLIISKKPLCEVFQYFLSNIGFAPRILFPQAVTLDLDNAFLPLHNEMALIQKYAHSHIQDYSIAQRARGFPAEPGRQLDKSRKRNDNIEKEVVQATRHKCYY